ncbi:bifunctional FolC family protein [Clostridium argentinense CDC 2741]|uniref:tetrahydrofolate synthase n=1 Tax=Clostridium argentinense CDC 2741 TaxID=1418104 RepID=A0A0C1TUS3_9CLOT|nr:folylpolyglutamate synthase/dihydrofolate synthase family protein [Clostridium argentinense]ARC84444.1 bifunctional folylpolyglutamate synthase/dihydrofolate synthase [Clostridium argentinense]KIE44474.1 bifunctional FolC family protein [Clostridium argentinense CDC 2741]NFF38773.1 bifunctional folylpolyglutamate synthase/dihydrofolate synthase [Clostridium argentinense]NFP48998.1 bifunctional folylpolyglutamate synthase/dihydrofolate synthase [Clostridium argentinense]NFP72546.1 bifunction
MNYDEAIKYIKETAKFGSKYGLERTEKILEFLGNPHKHIKTMHVAGTNGKGSTTAMLTSILMDAGYNVGTYISPYIEEFEERIQINRNNIPKEELAEVVTEVSKAVSKVVDLGYINPTEFEIITCAGFLYFHKKNIDYAVIEVGLGGRLDSTNVITPILSIISSISLDHTQILGDTLDKIAYEKAGIIKENVPVILFPQEKVAEDVIEKTCREKNSKLIKVPRDISEYVAVTSNTLEGKEIKTQQINLKNEYIDSYELSLLGKHQILNSTVVVYAARELMNLGIKISKDNIVNGLKSVQWPGRLEIMKNNPLVVIDGAHNIDGIKKLTESIDLYFKYNKLILILGILADKQVEDMIETIAPKAERIISVTPHSDRAELAEDLKIEIEKLGVRCEAIDSYEEAYKKALSYCNDDDLLLISGSLYMIGDMRKIIRNLK